MDNTIERADPSQRDPGRNGLEERVSRFECQLAEQREQLRDYEKSLVERIADVDDDRRTTAAKLQRAWQTQREEIDDRLRRQSAGVLGALFLLALLVGGALYFSYRQAETGRKPAQDEIAEIRAELARLGTAAGDDDPMRDALTRLSGAVDDVSASLRRLEERQADGVRTALEGERAARETALSGIGEQIGALEAEQRRLTEGLDALRAALEALEQEQAATPPAAARDGVAEPEPEPVAENAEPPLAQDAAATDLAPAAEPATDTPVGGEARAEEAGDAGEAPETEAIGDRAYALQLIGFFSRDALLRFTERSGLPARVYYREDRYRGRPWFALIHSLHEDYAAAEAELSDLPPDLADLDPWIRPISGGELLVIETGTQP